MGTLKALFYTICLALIFMVRPTIAASLDSRAAALEKEVRFIEDVQEALYVLDYLGIEDIDGSFGPTTALAIRSFEADYGLTVTGKVTPALRRLLIATAFSAAPEDVELIGALSLSSDAQWGAAFARYTEVVAKTMAVRRCEQNSRYPKDCIEPVVGAGLEWITLITCGRLYVSASGEDPQAAEDKAIDWARGQGNRSYCSQNAMVNATFGAYLHDEELQELHRPPTSEADPRPVPSARVDSKGIGI